MKKVWVLGASGMLGSAICAQLEKRKIPCVATDKKEVDISSYAMLEAFSSLHEISHVVNCAGYTKVDLAEKEADLAYLANAQGPENLGRLARKIGAKVLHFSTDYIFSGRDNIPYKESDLPQPINLYGKSKYEGERRLLEQDPAACILRTSWLFGLRGRNFISTMLDLFQHKEEVRVVVDQIGRPTFCEDVSLAACQLLSHEGVFHFANREETSWHQFAITIYEEAKKAGLPLRCKEVIPIASHQYPSLATRPSYSVLDTQKIEKTLGIIPRSWKEMLSLCIRKYKEQ